LPDDVLRDASGFNTLTRNLGGAVGIALVNTWLIDFATTHGAALVQSLGQGPKAAQALQGLALRYGAEGLDPARSGGVAASTLADGLTTQALALAFDDVFAISAWIFAACLLLVPFCRGGPMTQDARHLHGH
jgi:DHA2 family multidrug resistance protein